MIMNGE